LKLLQRFVNHNAFLSAGGYHYHIALNTRQSKNGIPPLKSNTVIFHIVFHYPTLLDIILVLKRLIDFSYPITEIADHGVLQAIYLYDPDGNGV